MSRTEAIASVLEAMNSANVDGIKFSSKANGFADSGGPNIRNLPVCGFDGWGGAVPGRRGRRQQRRTPSGRVGRQTEDARTDQVKALTDAAGHQADGAGDDPEPDAETGEDDEAAEGEWASPPFILLLDSSEYDEELRALIDDADSPGAVSLPTWLTWQ